MTARRDLFDPAPLLRAAQLDVGTTRPADAARRLGVDSARICWWSTGGHRISAAVADRLAVRLGLHPAQLWPHWYAQTALIGPHRDRRKAAG